MRPAHVIVCMLGCLLPSTDAKADDDARVEAFCSGVHVGLSVGGVVGTSQEVGECSSAGGLSCAPELSYQRSLGLQAAPILEATVSTRVIGQFRFGLGVRALPGGRLSLGPELHLAIVPEAVFPINDDWAVTFRFFNSLLLDSPPRTILDRQSAISDRCRRGAQAGEGKCSASRSPAGMAIEMGAGLLRRYPGLRVRYQLALGGVLDQRHAMGNVYVGENPDDSERWRYETWHVESTRVVASAGLEW